MKKAASAADRTFISLESKKIIPLRRIEFLGNLFEMDLGYLPRVKLAFLPTPVELLENLSQKLNARAVV